ncbi:MAG: right-handed parallel beta-helix repeat-containing protein, partial [Thermoplasmata archaeon]|nr:right-handed parallel beta-helix repeat-containing protein [Thermoplasmata archaeon]
NTLSKNTCISNTRYGIRIHHFPTTDNYNIIINNTCSFNDNGIILYYTASNTLLGNKCSYNTFGISLYYSDHNILINNTCINNSQEGISLIDSDYNPLMYNNINGNKIGIIQRGSEIHDFSNDNEVHNNTILDNSRYGIRVMDNNEYSINATDNWWGHPSGPYHPSTNPDGKGNRISDYVEFDPWIKIPPDHVPPVAYIESVNPELVLVGENVSFSGYGNACGSIICYAWRSSIDEEFYNNSGAEFDYSGLSVGEHTVFLKVMDNYGVWSEEVNTTLIIHEKPVASIISINPDPALDTDTIAFIGNGTDDGSITRYIWRTDEQILYNGTNSSFGCSNLSVGTHTIYLKVLDDLGAWSEEVNTTLTIAPDTVPPTLSITSPQNNSEVEGTINITGTASDNVGILKVEYRLVGTDEWLQVPGTTSWSLELDTTQFEDGKPTFQFRAYDGKQYSEIRDLTIEVKNQEDEENGDSDSNLLMLTI